MLAFEDARQRMLGTIPRLGVESRALLDCLGQVLAEDIAAPEPLPPFDNSAMDGYAVRTADVATASTVQPASLTVLETVAAGYVPTQVMGQGQAIRIMTGAMLPEGSDAVVRVEDTHSEGERVQVVAPVELHENIRRAGESVALGQTVLTAGTPIRPQELAMLASLNVPQAPVVRKPVVAIVSTGDELTPLGEPLSPGRIRDSNRYGIHGQVVRAGGIPLDLGIVRDDADALERTLADAIQQADALITSGGVSVGDYDVVKDVLSRMGEINFWRVAMKPGKPQAYGFIQGKPVFGLPGNPVSSLIVFELFVRPALLRMGGHTQIFRALFPAKLEHDLVNDAKRLNFMRAIITQDANRFSARTTGPQGSGILHSLVMANGLIRIPPGATVKQGEVVQAQWLE